MKCAADVTFACDGEDDGCGFCYDHCPYKGCLVHKKPYGLTSQCMKPEDIEYCPMDDGAPNCAMMEGDECFWRCEHYKEVHVDEDGKITIVEEKP